MKGVSSTEVIVMKKILAAVLLCLTACTAEAAAPAETPGIPAETPAIPLTQDVTAELDGMTVTLQIPEDWQAVTVLSCGPQGSTATLQISPDGKEWLDISCTEDFGVCGTGLESKKEVLNTYSCTAGYYDGWKRFSWIRFDEPYQNLMIARHAEEGTNIDMDRAEAAETEMYILQTLEIQNR